MNPPVKHPYHLVLVWIAVLGIVLRFATLDTSVYWVDEVHTATRIAGYTRSQVQTQLFDQSVIQVSALEAYQVPTVDQPLETTWRALEQHPEHPPLYFLLGRIWLHGWLAFSQNWVLGLRSLSVLLSLLVFPGLYWLCRELFSKPSPPLTLSWMAIALFSIAPLHILYAQEARQYSLFTAITVITCAAFLKAVRSDRLFDWVVYTITVVIGLYSHLLFGLVAIAHGLYLALLRSPTKLMLRYALSCCISLITFMPWLVILGRYVTQVERAVDATQRNVDLNYLVNVWLRNLSRVFFSTDLGTANLLLLGLLGYALYRLYRETPRETWLFIIVLISVSAVPLLVTDVLTGGISSTRIRYLIPSYVGIHLAFAYWLSRCLPRLTVNSPPRPQPKWLWTSVALVMLIGMVTVSIIDATRIVSWTKSDKGAYYPAIATAINAAETPVVISDSSPTYILALSRLLSPNVALHLVTRPIFLESVDTFSDIFVFDPSRRLQRVLQDKWGYDLEPVVEQNESFQLLMARTE
ncbi:MAG: glycosyltransferase family 39 protein [Cyanobacteria bacterium J06627_8]